MNYKIWELTSADMKAFNITKAKLSLLLRDFLNLTRF